MFGDRDKAVFIKTLKLGEALLGLSFTDYDDAYDYSEKFFTNTSKHFIEHFTEHSDEPKGTFEKDLIRYNYIKAIEHRVASDIYADTSRGNVCDVLRSPFDIHMMNYPTNLPIYLEAIVNSFQEEAERLATEIISKIMTWPRTSISYQILNAVQFLGQAFGYHVGVENQVFNGYPCKEMLTRDEINRVAGQNLGRWLVNRGFEINGACFTREPCLTLFATHDNKKALIIFSAEIAPTAPSFLKEDLDEFCKIAMQYRAVPYYACVNLGSTDEMHFNDGVILASDGIRFMISAFDVLETE